MPKENTKRLNTKKYARQWAATARNTERRRAAHAAANPNDKAASENWAARPVRYGKGGAR